MKVPLCVDAIKMLFINISCGLGSRPDDFFYQASAHSDTCSLTSLYKFFKA